MNYTKFEDMEVWQLSRKLVKLIYSATNLSGFSQDFALKDQIRRSSISILSNIAEGFERKSNKEFIQFLNIAKGSAGELRAQIYISFDLKYLQNNEFADLMNLVTIISQSLSGLIKYLRKTDEAKVKIKS